MKVFIILSCIVAASLAEKSAKLPSSLKICTLNDPKRDECIKKSMQNFLSALHKKQEKLDYFQLEPLNSDSSTFEYSYENFFKGWFKFDDQKSYGMSNVKVLKVKSDFSDGAMNMQAIVNFPKLLTKGKYRANVSLNSLKFESKGDFNISMSDVTAKWAIKGNLENRNGEEYMKVYQFDVLPEIKDMEFGATGLFDNEELTKFTLGMINRNWRYFYQVMIPETRKQWEPIFIKICNKFFTQIPFKELLL